MATAPNGRTQSRSKQPLWRSGPIRCEARSSRGHCPCARSWRSAACAHRDIAPTDPRSAAVCERCAVRERVGRFGEAAPRQRRGEGAKRRRVRGPLRDSERRGHRSGVADFGREARPSGEAPSPRPSPRVRGEGVRIAARAGAGSYINAWMPVWARPRIRA